MRQFFALCVADLEETTRWYQENLGLSTSDEMNAPDGSARVIILEGDRFVVELVQHQDSFSIQKFIPGFADNHLLQGVFKVGCFVERLDELAERFEKNGVVFVIPIITDLGGRRFFLIRDNNGNLLQFFDGGAAS